MITLIALARRSGLTEFGYYSSGLAIGNILSGILGFGLATRALRLRAEVNPGLAASYLVTISLTSVLSALAIQVYGLVVTHHAATWALAASLCVAAESIVNLAQNILFGTLRESRAEYVVLLRRGVPLTAVLLLSFVGDLDIYWSAAIGFTLSVGVCVGLLGKLHWNGFNVRVLTLGSVQYWLAGMWSMLQQADVLVINMLLGPTASGAYAAAFRLASPAHIVTTSITTLLVPRLSAGETFPHRLSVGWRATKLASVYAVALVAVSPVMFFVGPILLGEQYARTGVLFSILTINSAISVVNQIYVARIYGEGFAATVAVATGLSTAVGMSAVFLGGKLGNLYAAAGGTVLIQVVLLLLLSVSWSKIARSHETNDGRT